MRKIDGPICSRCGFPFPTIARPAEAGGQRLCASCLSHEPPFTRSRQWGYYEGTLREAIHKFKYEGKTALAEPLGDWLAALASKECHLIIPVPLHKRRLRERGFNQSLLLAKRLGRALKLPVDYQSLIRTRPTPPQINLSREERLRNVRGAFAIGDRSKVSGRSILLIDDVITSGATVGECARTLLKAGAASVEVLALARAVAW